MKQIFYPALFTELKSLPYECRNEVGLNYFSQLSELFKYTKIKLKNPESGEYEGGLKRIKYIFVDDIEDPPHNSFTAVLENAEESIV